MFRTPSIDEVTFRVLVGAEEDYSSRERPHESGSNPTIKTSSKTLLAEDGEVGIGHGGVLKGVGGTLLASFNSVERMH